MQINIIHIDDDTKTLDYCKKIFTNHPALNYRGGFTKPSDAIDFLANEQIDLVFCDIEMPTHNGLWVANHLPYKIPIVFVTAHTGYAVDAFEACALHYLIKPFSASQLANVLERFNPKELKNVNLQEQVSQFYNNYLPQNNTTYPNKIYISGIGKIIIIDLSNVLYIEGLNNYTKFVMLNKEEHTSSKNLKNYTDALTYHPSFVRIHRSYLVNKNNVIKIHKHSNQQWYAEMSNGEKLELSKNRLDEILVLLQ